MTADQMNGFEIVSDPDLSAEYLESEARNRIEFEREKQLPNFEGVDALQLRDTADDPVDWLVDWVFGMDQPTLFGAPSKACKTTKLCDLAVAIATKTPWLGHFEIPKRRKVLFITGESNNRAISRRIAKAISYREGMTWENVQGWLRTETVQFPTLPSEIHQNQIRKAIEKHAIDVCIIDPLYRGLKGIDTHKVGEVGDAITGLARRIKPAHLIIAHHVTKSAARESGAPTLEDLTGAGIAESCGNWWLIGRREKYKYDKIHRFEVVYGGRDEQSGIRAITLDESGDDFTWTVETIVDAEAERKRQREEEQEQREAERLRISKASIKHCLANEKQFRPKTWIEDRSKGKQATKRLALAELLAEGSIKEGPYIDAVGRLKPSGFGIPGVAQEPDLDDEKKILVDTR